MKGPVAQVCPDCHGKKHIWVTDPDADGGKTKAPCEGCGAKGVMFPCDEPLCGELLTLKQVTSGGIWCEACAAALDVSDQEAERARLRWVG